MSPYRGPLDDGSNPRCFGLAYAGTRALDPSERALLAARITRRTWQAWALALGAPGSTFAALMVAARTGAASVVVLVGAVFVVGTAAAWSIAVDRALVVWRLKRDQQRGDVARFEGVLPDDLREDEDARRCVAHGLLKAGVETSVEVLPSAGLVWRMHDVLAEVSLSALASRNIRERRT